MGYCKDCWWWQYPVPYLGVRDKPGWGVCIMPDGDNTPVYIGTEDGATPTFMNTKADFGCNQFKEKEGVNGTIRHHGIAKAG